MPPESLRLSELRELTAEERAARIEQFAQGRNRNGELGALRERIAEFETRYEMSSATMRAQFQSGKLKETADIGRWLMLLNIRDGLERANS